MLDYIESKVRQSIPDGKKLIAADLPITARPLFHDRRQLLLEPLVLLFDILRDQPGLFRT